MSASGRAGGAANDLVTGGARTLAQLKEEVARRVGRGGPPLHGVRAEDANEAVQAIDSLDRDQWARAFMSVGDRHYERGEALEASDRAEAAQAYWHAWRLHHYARWPTENTPTRRSAKQRALDAFHRHGRLLDPAIETLRVPLDDREVVAYLRVPRGGKPAPVVLGISGLDSRKEDVAAHTESYLRRGMAIVAVDMPGTGEAPTSPGEACPERMFTVLIDYLLTRDDIDASRLVVQGRSFSGYWAAKLAYVERERLKGAVMHGGPIHHTFQRAWCTAALATGEYLYDYFEAWRAMMGATDLDDLLDEVERLSLLDMGLIDRASAPMLVVNGARDTQITIEDVFLLLEHGDAKDAWVNPHGGHMGRSPEWTPAAIADKVLFPWIERRLAA